MDFVMGATDFNPWRNGEKMAIQLNDAQKVILKELRICETTEEFQGLLAVARPEMERIFTEAELEPQQPNQPIDTTLLELQELYILVCEHIERLKATYTQERKELFRDAIRLLETAHAWFQDNTRTGAYRARNIEQIIQASRPWREEVRLIGRAAFVFKPKVATLFDDVNSTNTIEEEKEDLKALLGYLKSKEYRPALEKKGLTQTLIDQGEELSQEAEGRDLLAVLGIKSGQEALDLRNNLLSYATMLGQEARADAINTFSKEPTIRSNFEAKSFRNAIRKIKARRQSDPSKKTDTNTQSDDE
jgi:hypothetical protein